MQIILIITLDLMQKTSIFALDLMQIQVIYELST